MVMLIEADLSCVLGSEVVLDHGSCRQKQDQPNKVPNGPIELDVNE